jgi:oxalate decarboxylase
LHSGTGRATVFIGSATARTIDFSAGDTANFPDNAGHYIENTSETENLVWIEIYKSDRVADISLAQCKFQYIIPSGESSLTSLGLALTPPDIVAFTLKIPLSVAQQIKKEKQLLVKG